MLIPSVVAMVIWLIASGYLVFQGFYNREVANGVRQVSIPAVPALGSIQQERRLSVAYLAQPTNDLQALLDQRRRTDELLSALRSAANSALANAPGSITTRWQTLTEQLDQLPNVRSTIDSRSAGGAQVYAFYNQLLDAATSLFDTQARVVPDVTAAQGGIAATETFRASDLMSRSASIIDGAFGSRALGQESHLDFVRLIGAYHSALENVAPHLQPDARRQYEAITASEAWQRLVAAENELVGAGAWRDGTPRGLSANRSRWESLTRQVSDDLIALTVAQADQVSARALRTGNNQLLTASLGSLMALAIAVAAILWAIRQSQVLVDRALSVRLAQLGRDAAVVVDERLPAIMERLRRHEKVDLDAELPSQNYGSDEIGQVADVINRSLQAAAAAAVDEAKTRAAGVAMLMGVARRPQRPLQRGLKVIEDLQNRIGDEKLLTELFDINHQLTQTRRFLENLVILAGGQIGRRFQNPVPVRRVMLAAFAEAQHYQRITLRSAPDVALLGHSVAGTIHLLAELLDNALAFSPPGTTVWVTCNEVKRGVAVEIEDAGVGMKGDALEEANHLLATAPTPDVTALNDGAQIGLHVVAELAKRDGIQVSLRTSAYGGLLAIVLLPDRIITALPADGGGRGDMGARRSGTPSPGAGDAGRPGPRLAAAVGGYAPAVNGSGPVPGVQTVEGRRPDRAGGMMNDNRPINQQAGNGSGVPRQRESAEGRTVDAGRPGQRSGPGAPAVSGPSPAGTPAAGTRVTGGAPPAAAPQTRPPAAAGQPGARQTAVPPANRPQEAGRPATGAGTGPRPTGSEAGTDAPVANRPPLPHRQPQQHLVPQLRDERPTGTGSPGTGPARTPEEARSRFTQYQRAWAAGQTADTTETAETATIDDQGRNA
ncbi:nitrate- and nitrite sensing domain-containing protein [Plantactinospora sp. B24E8]|uniref:sensor histidine kinase n=1 Tax=Plantactinospora sp. B24E8 TaxID=3153567 RepID=UPI00325DB225